jgi:putative transposase
VVEWGKGTADKIFRRAHQVDKMTKRCKAKGVHHKQRYRLKKQIAMVRRRIRAMVDDTHRRLAKYLCENYRAVLLPEFSITRMVSRRHRKIGRRTARSLYTWAPYRFRMTLLAKVREYPWCTVVLCDEAYTSMTCGACGQVKYDLGGAKIFRCRACGYVADRDANGARNILLKFLEDCGVDLSRDMSASHGEPCPI